jgi:hypothetical protein
LKLQSIPGVSKAVGKLITKRNLSKSKLLPMYLRKYIEVIYSADAEVNGTSEYRKLLLKKRESDIATDSHCFVVVDTTVETGRMPLLIKPRQKLGCCSATNAACGRACRPAKSPALQKILPQAGACTGFYLPYG